MKETRIEIRKKCEDATYTVQYVDGTVIETGTIPSGDSKTITVPPGVDATWTLVDEDGNTLDNGTIAAGGSAVIEAPNADYVITDEDSNMLYNGTILSGGNLAQQISNSTFETKQSDGTTIHTDSILAEGNGSRNIADSVITLEDTDNNTISTTNVKATDSATIQAPDGTVTVVDSGNNILGGVVVPSGGSDTFEVPNENITVNGNLLINKPSAQDYNVEVVDTENNAVSTSISGGKVIIDDLPTPLYYGVEWDTTAATTVMTRIGNMDMHRTLPIQSQMKRALIKDDGSVNYWLDDNDSNLKADGVTPANLSGDDGQVMVRLPEHYRKFESQGDKQRALLSLHPLDGFERVPERWVSAYEATVQRSTNKLSSVISMDADYRGGNNNAANDLSDITLLGKPASAISRINFRAYARNRGTMQWNMMLHEVRKTIFWLYYVEHANMNCQIAFNPAPTAEGYTQGGLGPGVTTVNGTDWSNYNGYYPFVPCGITNSLGNNTGVVDYSPPGWPSPITVSVPSFRGIENPFGHLWEWIDGVNIRIQADSAGGLSEIYLADSLVMSDVDYVGYTHYNYLPRNNGYIQAIHHYNGEILPKIVTGASSNTFWSDYFYTTIPTSGEVLRGVLSGGNALSGSNAGLGYSNTNYVPTYATAHVGSRLCFLPEGV